MEIVYKFRSLVQKGVFNINTKAFRTKEHGFLLIILEKFEGDQSYIFLLDPWKVGVKDVQIMEGSLNGIKKQIGIPNIEFYSIPFEKAKEVIARGYQISKIVGNPISKKLLKVYHQLNLDQIIVAHLFLCFNCEKNPLSPEQNKEIIKSAKEDLQQDLVGSKDENQYFFICDNCKNKLQKTKFNL